LLPTWLASMGLRAARRSRRACTFSERVVGMATSTVEGVRLVVVDGCRAGRFRMIEVDCGWVDAGGFERRADLFIRMLETDCDWVSFEEEGIRAGRVRLPVIDCDWVNVGALECRAGLFIRMLETDCDWVSVGEEGPRAGRFRLPEMGCDGAHG